MDLPKCKTCSERHRLGPCPSPQIKRERPDAQTSSRSESARPTRPIQSVDKTQSKPQMEVCQDISGSTRTESIIASRSVNALVRGEAVTHQVTVNHPTEGSNPAEPAKKPFDRNEAHRNYMRGYMRKRRAEGKGYQRKTEGPTNKGRPCK